MNNQCAKPPRPAHAIGLIFTPKGYHMTSCNTVSIIKLEVIQARGVMSQVMGRCWAGVGQVVGRWWAGRCSRQVCQASRYILV